MAFTGDLGRVQGASTFHTMATSSTSVAISNLQPQLTPFVGDAVQFPNGDVRQITAVNSSTITLGDVLFSIKGDPGIGNATLSNIDGDSTVDGFTQAAVKGVAQAKNYYNEGVYDSSVSNGDGTVTVQRKTLINEDGTQSLLPVQYQYSEQVPENQPIHIANQEECLYWHEEWRKGLNLLNNSAFNSIGANLNAQFEAENGRLYLSSLTSNNANKYDTIKVNLLPNSIYTVHITGYNGYYNDVIVYAKGTSSDIPLGNNGVYGIELGRAKDNITFTTTEETEYYILIELKDETTAGNYTYTDIMLVRGSHPYPYEPYNGKILRETDLSGIQLFPIDINPAETIGGDWEDLGTITTSSSTVLHAYRRLS